MLYTLLALALGPGLAIMLFIYWKDKHDREPVKHLVICFLLGLLSVVPAVFIEQALTGVQSNLFEARSVSGQLFSAFVVAAAVEEAVKFLFCRIYAYPKNDFNEPLDGIVYMVMVAMGFATLENVFYIFSDEKGGISTGVMRMFLAVPGHACWGVIIGYFMGLAKFKRSGVKRIILMLTGLLLAILLHGTYDALLFIQQTDRFKDYGLPLFGGAVLTAIVSYIFAFSAIKKHRRLSHQLFVLNKTAPISDANNTYK